MAEVTVLEKPARKRRNAIGPSAAPPVAQAATDVTGDAATGQQWERSLATGGSRRTRPRANAIIGSQRGPQASVANAADPAATHPATQSASGDDALSAFTKLAPAIDFIVPTEGSAGELDAELRIPASHGVFVGIHATMSLERLEGQAVQLGASTTVTVGASVGAAHASFEFGGYIQVQGDTTKSALTVLSWVLYRQMSESNAPKEVEEAWFGSSKKKQTAEQWDAEIRKTYFAKSSDNWAEVGMQIGAAAKGGIGIAKGKASATLQQGRLYDAESIERRSGAKSLTQRFTSLFKSSRGAQASLGDRISTVIGQVALTTPLASGSLSVTVAVRQVKDKRGKTATTKYELDTLEVDGTVSCVGMETAASLLSGANGVVDLARKVAERSAEASKHAGAELESRSAQAGSAVSDVEGYADAMLSAANAASGLALGVPGLGASGQVHVTGGYDPKKKKPYLSLAFEKVIALDVDFAVLSVTASRTERLASIEYSDGAWVAHLGELRTVLNQGSPKTNRPAAPTSASPPGSKGGTQ
jgi:hypothetical protein